MRAAYREALEDGLDDKDAEAQMLRQFAVDLADDDNAPVVWLALAVSQHERGRLSTQARDRASSCPD